MLNVDCCEPYSVNQSWQEVQRMAVRWRCYQRMGVD